MDMKNIIATLLALLLLAGLVWFTASYFVIQEEQSDDIKKQGRLVCANEGAEYLGYSVKTYGTNIYDVQGEAQIIKFECYDKKTGEVNLVNWRAR